MKNFKLLPLIVLKNSYFIKITFHPGRTNVKSNKKLTLLSCVKYPLLAHTAYFLLSYISKGKEGKMVTYRTSIVYKLWSCILLKNLRMSLPNILPNPHLCLLYSCDYYVSLPIPPPRAETLFCSLLNLWNREHYQALNLQIFDNEWE